MSTDLEALKRLLPLPQLLEKIGLGEFAKPSCRSPFREDRNPSWGIYERDGKWFFKDHGDGDRGDEITVLARWKLLDERRDFPQLVRIYADLAGVHVNGDTRQPSTGKAAAKEANPFDWSNCVSAVGPAEVEKLAKWRGYSADFSAWLSSAGFIGLRNGNWALPVHGDGGAVVACHYRVDHGHGKKPDWFFWPKGMGVQPLVFGDPRRASCGFVCESPWDAFAVMDKLGWHKPKGIPETAIVITRGASNGRLVGGLFAPGTAVYAFKQNDPTKNGKNAADSWLTEVCTHAGCSVFHVATPGEFKDVNEWTQAGATGPDIMAAIQDAKPVGSRVPSVESVLKAEPWPVLDAAALHGVAGELVRRLDPHTESDPAAILFQLLVAFGNTIGRTAYFEVEAHKHFCNMNAVLVGNSSKARKGTSWGHVRALLEEIDATWRQPASGLSTGEGLIWAVRDPIIKRDSEGGEEIVDEGEPDKRLLVVEEEFSRPLKCANRENNTLSAVFRQAFDSGNLRILTKTNPAKATGAHVSSIGHITKQELSRHLTETQCANGFANRILWVCVRRSKELPEGGNSHLVDFSDVEDQLRKAISHAERCGALRRDTEARELWCKVYHDLSEAKPGLFGAVTSRAEAYVVRLSLLYAVLDCAESIQRVHLEAALAAWRYCEDSARYVFGESLGDADADAILAALREAGSAGLTRTEINEDVFNRHRTKTEIDRALNALLEHGLAESKANETGGRAAERWFAP